MDLKHLLAFDCDVFACSRVTGIPDGSALGGHTSAWTWNSIYHLFLIFLTIWILFVGGTTKSSSSRIDVLMTIYVLKDTALMLIKKSVMTSPASSK